MTLTRIRLAIGLLGALGVGVWLWTWIVEPYVERRVTKAVEAVQAADRADTVEQVEAEEHEQLQQRHDARTSEAARREVERVDGAAWDSCPSVPARFGRLLNAIGKDTAAAELAGALPGEAGTSGG